MLEPYVRSGIDDRPDLGKVLNPEDKAAVTRLAIKSCRRPPETSTDQPEAQAVRLASVGSLAAAAVAASVDTPAPDMSSVYLDMRDPMVAVNGQRPTADQVSRLNWGFFVASILVGAPWMALNTITMPNAIARTFGYDIAVAGHIAINPATGHPLSIATELVMPPAMLMIVGVVASMFAMPLISVLSGRTRTPLGRRIPWTVGRGLLCALITLILGQSIGITMLCIFRVFLQSVYAMLSVPLTSVISEQVPDRFRPRIECWHGTGVMPSQALGVCMDALGVMFNSFAPFSYTAVLFAVPGIVIALILPKELSSAKQPNQLFDCNQVLDQLRPPAHAPELSRVFAVRTCMMAGVGLTGVFLWYLVRFWVYDKAVVLTSALLTIPVGFLITGMAVATLIGAALASWATGPISERIGEENIPVARVVADACLLYVAGSALAWGFSVWSTDTARENGILLLALISGLAFGAYDSLGLELVMDPLPDPRRAGHDLGIYALANLAGPALAAITGALLVNAFEHSFGYYLLFPSAIIMVLLAGIATLTTKSAE